MNINQSFDSVQKNIQASAEKFTPAAMQEALQPMMSNMKAWNDLIQGQAQASQNVATETLEALKNVKEPQAAIAAMSALSENFMAMTSKNIKDTVALSMAQFKDNVASLEKSLPASDALTSLANSLKDSASKMESSVESSVNMGTAAIKTARSA